MTAGPGGAQLRPAAKQTATVRAALGLGPGPARSARRAPLRENALQRPQPLRGVEGRWQRRFPSGPRGIAPQFGSPPLQPCSPRPQHPTRSVPGSRGPWSQRCTQATAAGSGERARPSARAAAPPGEPPSPRPGARDAVSRSGARVPRRAAGEQGRNAAASVRTRLGWRRAGLGAAGAHKTRKVTGEVARCLAVCLQRAPRLGTRLYNLTHNWP